MKPFLKLHSITFGLTTALVFGIWTLIIELIQFHPSLKIMLGALISLGLYRLVAGGIIYLTIKSNQIKKLFLGAYYLQGTWVGFYIGTSGKERFLIERFEQKLENLVIRGSSYNELSKYHSQWIAKTVNIDVTTAQISYMYDCLPIHNNANNNGIAIFNFERDDQYSPAKRLIGFSSDLHIGQRIRALEIKISDQTNIPEEDALKKAKEVYKKYKDKF